MSLSFTNITFRYRRSRQTVFQDFSWQVPPGRTVLLGPNGAGKSTLLALGANALPPRRGKIHAGNLNASRQLDQASYRRSVGWMSQYIRAVPGLKVQEQIAYAAWLKGLSRKQAWVAATDALAWVDLSELAEHKTATLSGGQLRRVGLAQVIVHNPNVLLLDEPTTGLDPAQRSRFRELLTKFPPECSVVVSTHQVDDLTDLFNTVVVLTQGRIKFSGTVPAFLELVPKTTIQHRAEAAYAQVVAEE